MLPCPCGRTLPRFYIESSGQRRSKLRYLYSQKQQYITTETELYVTPDPTFRISFIPPTHCMIGATNSGHLRPPGDASVRSMKVFRRQSFLGSPLSWNKCKNLHAYYATPYLTSQIEMHQNKIPSFGDQQVTQKDAESKFHAPPFSAQCFYQRGFLLHYQKFTKLRSNVQ